MAEYISREAVMDALLHEQYGYLCEDAIKSIPAAEVRPVVKAKWDDKPVAFFLKCTKCGCCVGHRYYVFLDRGELNFCPNCGADMR